MDSQTWPKNAWYVAAFSHEVQGKLLARKFLGKSVVMYRRTDDSVVALEDRCAHRLLPLSFGFVENDNVTCGYHGMTFDASGKCVRIPGQDKIPASACVRSFPLVEKDRLVWIWMGDASQADPALIPDMGRLDHPEWIPAQGYHHLKADYRLLNDNLLDLSHVAFVHGRTIGNAAVANSPITVSQNCNVVSVHRDVIGALAPPFFEYLGKFTKPIHRWHTVNYHPPSICMIEVGCKPLDGEDGVGKIEGVVFHMATPETETTTHYFWAFIRHFRQQDPALTEYIRQAITATHGEDKVVLELQQTALTETERDNPAVVAIAVDAGPIRGRRLLEQMIGAERQQKETALGA
ncbi:vanillate O-demethylase monooxygenase subunit [Noviherbaspirillum humi]|uniref:Vanillate O-demethylase monooxygenase subunit n=1 Tax=Noviherbaspirillum humi TaxID=1688639 RepID=A0A239G5U7_9BURK|nr:aromatic ring-hydroxylating dioxygenase subunit alpha [Noviherbaspirillum humi]SNS64726.1 vanillate O-demethylase monooxygenase subunit [Noviherbaspirillum humi]